ncbi:MAG: hypothetical protein ACKOPS_01255, partial [Cyanobium sp.]
MWVDHLRAGLPQLEAALEASHVAMHPWVIGELACGNLRHRAQVLQLLQGLPKATVASDGEVPAREFDEHQAMHRHMSRFERSLELRHAGSQVVDPH